MKLKHLLLLCLLFLFGCSNLLEPEVEKRKFIIKSVGTTTTKINDSTYYFYVDSAQWQTFERIYVIVDESVTIKITWNAYCKKNVTYYYAGQYFLAPLINTSSYTDKNNQSNTMLSVYNELVDETVLVMAGYKYRNITYFDYKYFVIKFK